MADGNTSGSSSSPEDWVHCNRCFKAPGSKPQNFYVTNCPHIVCQECHTKFGPQCPSCKKDTNFIPISNKMPKAYRDMLTDPFKLLRTYQKQVENIAGFQNENRRKLMKHKSKQADKSNYLMDYCKKEMDKAAEYKKKMNKIRKECLALKAKMAADQKEMAKLKSALSQARVERRTPKSERKSPREHGTPLEIIRNFNNDTINTLGSPIMRGTPEESTGRSFQNSTLSHEGYRKRCTDRAQPDVEFIENRRQYEASDNSDAPDTPQLLGIPLRAKKLRSTIERNDPYAGRSPLSNFIAKKNSQTRGNLNLRALASPTNELNHKMTYEFLSSLPTYP